MSLLMSACCCEDQCECVIYNTPLCWNYYLIKQKTTYVSCEEFDCCGGLTEYRVGIYFTNSCTPPTADAVLNLYKAGSIQYNPAEVTYACDGNDHCSGFTFEYESCSLILSAQQTVCTQTFSFPNAGPFNNEFGTSPNGYTFTADTTTDPNGSNYPYPDASQGFSNEVLGLYFNAQGYTTHAYKATGFPDPNCGTDFDYSVYGLTIIIPACVETPPVGCCP